MDDFSGSWTFTKCIFTKMYVPFLPIKGLDIQVHLISFFFIYEIVVVVQNLCDDQYFAFSLLSFEAFDLLCIISRVSKTNG